MFGIKTKFFQKINKFSINTLSKDILQDKPTSPIIMNMIIHQIISILKEQKKNNLNNFGHLISYPDKSVIMTWGKLLPFNPGNLGNWSIKSRAIEPKTTIVEQQLIKQLINLYHGNPKSIEGYFTTGSTEANIFSCWLGKKKLIKNGLKESQICLLKTRLSHYSIRKSADITFTKYFNVSLNSYYGISQKSLIKTVQKLRLKNFHGFLIPLTLGYTLTGTNDNITATIKTIRYLKKEYPEYHFYLWIDAALSGLILPFVKEGFSPFKYPEVQSISADFHKLFGIPIPSSFILYSKPLRKLVEKEIDYLSQRDNTLLGSRTGIAPVASWFFLNLNGKKKIKQILNTTLKKKKIKIEKIIKKYPGVKVISSQYSLNAAIFSSALLKIKLAKQYNLIFKKVTLVINNKKQKKYISKLFFLN